jgi:replicative DNA helicase
MPTTTYNFSDDFQDQIIACIIRHPDQFDIFSDLIKPEYFNGTLAYETVARIREFFLKYNKFPGFSTLANYAHQKLEKADPDKATQIFEYIDGLTALDVSEKEAIYDMVVPFARERALLHLALNIQKAQREGKDVKGGLMAMFEQAMSVGVNIRDTGVILQRDYAEIIDRHNSESRGIETGFQPLNDLWRTGWAPGWLIVPLAPPKRYKTTFAINLAMNMVHDNIGADVIYYACEIDQDLAALRAMCCITGHTFNDLIEAKAHFKQTTGEVIQGYGGRLLIKSYPSRAVTITDLRMHARNASRQLGLKPKAIFIDYADTVRSDLNPRDHAEYKLQADVYTQARKLGHDLNCAVIMPDRCKVEFVDKPVPSMKAFQGSFEKAGIVDIGIGICQTDKERQDGTVRYFVFLNRHGPEGMLYRGKVDAEKYRMTIDENIPYDPEEADRLEAERLAARRPRRRGDNFNE